MLQGLCLRVSMQPPHQAAIHVKPPDIYLSVYFKFSLVAAHLVFLLRSPFPFRLINTRHYIERYNIF